MNNLHQPILVDTLNDRPFTEDLSSTSEEFFQIRDFPSVFMLGYNSFKVRLGGIDPTKNIYATGQDSTLLPLAVYIQEPKLDTGEYIVTVVVFPDNQAGSGIVYLRATTLQGTDIRWSRSILISKTRTNTAPLVYKNLPRTNIRNLNRYARLEVFQEGGSDSRVVSQSNKFTGTDVIYNSGSTMYLDVRNSSRTFAHSDGFYVSSSMVEGTIYLDIPIENLPFYQRFYDLTEENNTISASIDRHVGRNTLEISGLFQDNVQFVADHKYLKFFNADYVIEYNKTLTYIDDQSTVKQYIEIELIDGQPISGESYLIEVLGKLSAENTVNVLTKEPITPNEFLTDTGSLSFLDRIGTVELDNIVNTYWESDISNSVKLLSGSYTTPLKWEEVPEVFEESRLILEYGGERLVESIFPGISNDNILGPSYKVGSDLVDYSDPSAYLELRLVSQSYTNNNGVSKKAPSYMKYYPFAEYEITFEAYSETNAGSDFKDPLLEVYLTGTGFPVSSQLGHLIGSISSGIETEHHGNVSFVFSSKVAGQGVPRLVVRSGIWTIKDVSIRPYYKPGFTLGHTYLFVEVPDRFLNRLYDIDVKFLNRLDEGVTEVLR